MKIKYSICVKEFDAGMFGVYVRCEQFGKSWKSHKTLTLLAKQDCPLWLQYD